MDVEKTTHEIVQGETADPGKSAEEERLKRDYFFEGQKLAVEYIKENIDFAAKLSNYEEKARKYVIKGAESVFLVNIFLPINDIVKSRNKKIIDGLIELKSNKPAMEATINRIKFIFNQYTEQVEQQRNQASESLKVGFRPKPQQAVEKQSDLAERLETNVENPPQLKEEWRRTKARLDYQYSELLEKYRWELKEID